ncbi:MAG TPA: DUF3999 family protein [Xanthomonadaceae bacterium]|nr:DUF3999 family protein [Xanthomonadaceae bacterium]
MKIRTLFAGLLLGASVAAATPADYASQWTVSTNQEGAYSIALDEGIYRQATREDLSDVAAFNADGEELAFGPLPAAYDAPSSKWHDAVWFALPAQPADPANGDLQLHVNRSADGSLSLDSTLSAASSGAPKTGTQDLLVDMRAKDRLIEAIAFDFATDTPDFSADVEVEASDDLKDWHPVASNAPLASFRQHGAYLLRRTVEFPAQQATYLRVHASMPLPVSAVHQLQREAGSEPARASIDAGFVRRDGNAFIYRLPARVEVERLSIALADDNAVAHFRVSAREEGENDWRSIGDYTAFRLRGAGVVLDAEPMEVDASRAREWRIEPDQDENVARTPKLRFDYRPETWVVLTHGRAPYTIVAGSKRAHRGDFPIEALIGQLRTHYGPQWQPPTIGHGPMRASAGEAALNGWDAAQGRTWLLWGVLVLGAGAVAFMVIGLLRSPPKPKE